MCLHSEIEPYDDEPSRGACASCGEDCGIRVAPSVDGEYDDTAAEEGAVVDAAGRRRGCRRNEAANGPGDVPGPHAVQRRMSAKLRASRVYACDSPFGT